MSQILETNEMTQVVKAVQQLMTMGKTQYSVKVISRGPNKGTELFSQTPIQREIQNKLYHEAATTAARFLSAKLNLPLEERGSEFRFTAYPCYMGDLGDMSVLLAFEYLTNTGVNAEFAAQGEPRSKEERAALMAITFERDAVWQVGGNVKINPEALA